MLRLKTERRRTSRRRDVGVYWLRIKRSGGGRELRTESWNHVRMEHVLKRQELVYHVMGLKDCDHATSPKSKLLIHPVSDKMYQGYEGNLYGGPILEVDDKLDFVEEPVESWIAEVKPSEA
ncbi:hypothetical protein Tco_0646142 [Tanacetum coccineum]